MSLTTKIVAGGFVGALLVVAIASWDAAKGRAPETESPLLLAVLQASDQRTCTRDATALIAPLLPVGMERATAERLIRAATVTPPRPLFWSVVPEDSITQGAEVLRFTRVLRYTIFGNHRLSGEVRFENGAVSGVTAQVACAFG
jgi:hypothetical protein